MIKGFFGRLLVVDASHHTSHVEELDEKILQSTLGGKGLATRLLLDRNPVGVDPLAPENHFIIALGPASDSAIYGSCRHGLFSKSPLTGFYAESYSGGRAAIPMSRAGYDAVVIHGASAAPVWLEINEQGCVFHDASDLWGKDTYETEDAIKARLGNPDAAALVIGPAGEKLVRFAVVENDYWRSAGRSGLGAVLGSKKIKGVTFFGRQPRPVADPAAIKAYAREMLANFKDHKGAQTYRDFGTPVMVSVLNKAGGFPTRYWSRGSYESWEKINAETLLDRCKARPKACRACFMGCGKFVEVQEGRHKGLKLEGPEYETIYSFGGLCCIDDLNEIIYFNDLCDRLGMDTITSGNLVAFAIEAAKRGKIDAGYDYGDPDLVADLLHKIAKREGIGDLLAEGIKPASAQLGLEDIAVHVKGMEPAGYDPRALKGMGLAYAVSDRGACHLRSTFYKAELAGMIDIDQIEGKAKLFLDFEDRCTLHDCLIVCRFYRDFYTWEEIGKLVAMTTGMELNQEGLRAIASRVTDSTRHFNIREGLTAADDRLPKRFISETLESGKHLSAEEVATMVRDYYRLRGWDDAGHPRP